jgi:anaerobic magnesium-protoporphyrin IX monomethyl ester cyclase
MEKNKILFSHPYFLHLDRKQAQTGLPYPPLGTLYAAALVRDRGYEVSLFDPMFAPGPSALGPYLGRPDLASLQGAAEVSDRPDFFVVYADGFNYLTKMCLTNMREATFEMIRMARDRGCTVIISSSDSTDHTEAYLKAGADYVINGEAELTLVELLDSLSSGVSVDAVKGLAFLDASEASAPSRAPSGEPTAGGSWNAPIVKHTPARPIMKDWSWLPMPAFDLVDMDAYRQTWLRHVGYFSLNAASTRGCPFHCNWCAKPIYGNRYTVRPAKQVASQLAELKRIYGFDHIWFCDDIFGLKPGWIKEFADAVEEEGLAFTFKIQSRADLMDDLEVVSDLARAGCDSVWMGAESGSQKILDAMEKGTTITQIEKATRLLKSFDIKACWFIQFGYPGETKEEIHQTIALIRRCIPEDIGISVSYPLPGTAFFEQVKASMGDKANWTDSDDLALMFQHTFPPGFYRRLHKYVHHAHRYELALRARAQGWGAFRKRLSACYYLGAAQFHKWLLPQIAGA